MMNVSPSSPIGVFDSGVGGLSVWKELVKLLPNESTIYFADSANCPYGEKSQDEIIALSRTIVDFLLGKGCKMIVVACNTATSAAIDYLRDHYTIPFVGMEPAVKPAALSSTTGVVGILATAGTLKGRLFNETKRRFASSVTVIETVGKGLVEAVERGELATEKTKLLLHSYIQPMLDRGIDYLVLGCTHYPFLMPIIQEIAGEGVHIIDPAPSVALQAKQLLSAGGMLNPAFGKPTYTFYTSGSEEPMRSMLKGLGVENYCLVQSDATLAT